MDWSHLTIRQSANDHHRIVSAIRPLYQERWVNEGASNGGMTVIYHRRFYPEDVDATIPYVAPLKFGGKDPCYADFLENVGTEKCWDPLKTLHRKTLKRRPTMVKYIKEWFMDEAKRVMLIYGESNPYSVSAFPSNLG